MFQYLRAVEHAANAISALSSKPLTERRFLLLYPSRAEAVGQPGLYPGLLGLLGAPQSDRDILTAWLPDWDLAYQTVPVEKAPPRLHAERHLYYRQAFDKLVQGAHPHNILAFAEHMDTSDTITSRILTGTGGMGKGHGKAGLFRR